MFPFVSASPGGRKRRFFRLGVAIALAAVAFVSLWLVFSTRRDETPSIRTSQELSRRIATLELASRVSPAAVSDLVELSTAYVSLYRKDRDCLDLLRAVRACDRALVLDRANRECLFVRARALSLLGTRHLARKAWREIDLLQEGDPKSGAGALFRNLYQEPLDDQWTRDLPRFHHDVATLTERFPANARRYAEEILLPRFAVAIDTHDETHAKEALRDAALVADTLARSRGEHLLEDAVVATRRTMSRGTDAERRRLLEGIRAYGEGVALWNEQKLESAKAPLDKARRNLAAAGNPLRFWAWFYLATCEYYANASRGSAMLEELLKTVSDERYPTIVGRAEWAAGTADKVQGRIQSSVHRYEHAAACLRRGGGEPAGAFVGVLLAESYTLLGEHSLAWKSRQGAFQAVPYSEGPRRNIAMWTEAKEALLRQGNLELAGPLVEEAVSYADIEQRPLSRATAHLDRAAYRLSIDDHDGAWADLRDANAAIAQMERGALRDQMTYLAFITEGLCVRKSNPARAADLLRRGLAGQRATGTRFDAITYTTALADAQLTSGDVTGGTKSLEEAISIFEQIRETVEDPVSRMQAFRQAQPAFDRLIELKANAVSMDPEELFRLAERSRARMLLDMRGGGDFARLSDLERALPSGVALASYIVLDHEIVVWFIEDGHTRKIQWPASRVQLVSAIERFRLELQHGGDIAEIQRAAAPLYDDLIRRLGLSASGHSLIIVPDRWLARLPFGPLYDQASHRYLIEQRIVTIAPSATLLLHGSRSSRTKNRTFSALAVAVSQSGEFQGRAIPGLPRATTEASAVARTYGHSSLLIGAEATRENFLQLSVSANVVHFAGHAVVDLDAPRRSVLLFSGETGETLEPLSLGELFDAGTGNADLVVLSACRSQDSIADREGLLGIAGAFIAAGVREAVASPIDVDDELSPAVMALFHRHYAADRSAGIAFRRAVLDLLRSRSELRSPAAWGGFTVIQGTFRGGNE